MPAATAQNFSGEPGQPMILSPTPLLERSHGAAHLRLARRRGLCVVADLAQQGSAKVFLPRGDPANPEVVFLNTSGGMTSGDRLRLGLSLGDGVGATATTQTAERAYKALQGPADVRISADVGANGWLHWLPQETILFEDGHLHRDTRIDLGQGARCLLGEIIVLGRRAMGERPERARLQDSRMVRIQGRPVWAESLRLDAGILDLATAPAMLGANAAFAVLALVGQGAEAAAEVLRAIPVIPGVAFAVSGWNGRTIARLMAPDLWPLKQQLAQMLPGLSKHPLPRVWQMQGLAA